MSLSYLALDCGTDVGNTTGMKVAISIPDEVFAEAESLAKELKASRSDVYCRALKEFLGRHAPDRITEQMDRVVADAGGGGDKFVRLAGRNVLRRVEW
jgi:predicted transcriptional regulator